MKRAFSNFAEGSFFFAACRVSKFGLTRFKGLRTGDLIVVHGQGTLKPQKPQQNY